MPEFQEKSTFVLSDNQWYNPTILNAATIKNYSGKMEIRKKIIKMLSTLEQDSYSIFLKKYLFEGNERFGSEWEYHDILTVLFSCSSILKPVNYLEIGVRRGRSLAAVISAYPKTNAYCFDLWQKDYAGIENPGPEFVAKEIKKFSHSGNLQFISGDSKITIPEFKLKNSKLQFDLITIDGDHTSDGAERDIINTLDILKVGGVIVMDDISHPEHLYLDEVWNKLIDTKRFTKFSYTELGYGISFAVKMY